MHGTDCSELDHPHHNHLITHCLGIATTRTALVKPYTGRISRISSVCPECTDDDVNARRKKSHHIAPLSAVECCDSARTFEPAEAVCSPSVTLCAGLSRLENPSNRKDTLNSQASGETGARAEQIGFELVNFMWFV